MRQACEREDPRRQAILSARENGVPWKTIAAAYGLSRTRLWEIACGIGNTRQTAEKDVDTTSAALLVDSIHSILAVNESTC